jgi:hypothetical protein
MRKHCSNVCKMRPCLDKESKNSARMRTIVTAALQRQYSQTELNFWISYVPFASAIYGALRSGTIYSHNEPQYTLDRKLVRTPLLF